MRGEAGGQETQEKAGAMVEAERVGKCPGSGLGDGNEGTVQECSLMSNGQDEMSMGIRAESQK